MHFRATFLVLLCNLVFNGIPASSSIQEPEKIRDSGIYVDCGCSKTCSVNEEKFSSAVLVYKMLTPSAIQRSASFILQPYTLSPLQLTFNSESSMADLTKLLQIPLLHSSTARPGDDFVVKITVGLDTTFGKTLDSDVMFMLSDGVFAQGFYVFDKGNYAGLSPCLGVEGKSATTLLNKKDSPHAPAPSDKGFYASRVEITLHVAERWGTCYTAHDAGFTREMSFTNKLDPTKGLSFELYKQEGDEKVGIKFLEFMILKEN